MDLVAHGLGEQSRVFELSKGKWSMLKGANMAHVLRSQPKNLDLCKKKSRQIYWDSVPPSGV